MMEYKGYTATVWFDDQADLFHGEVLNIRDVVTFQGKTVKELKRAVPGFGRRLSDVLCRAR